MTIPAVVTRGTEPVGQRGQLKDIGIKFTRFLHFANPIHGQLVMEYSDVVVI